MERCAEIAFSARQNAQNEYQEAQKKQVQNWFFLKLWVFEQACLYLKLEG
jgi:hypothetical protein